MPGVLPMPKMKMRIILSALLLVLLNACSTIAPSGGGSGNARPTPAVLQLTSTTAAQNTAIPTGIPTFTPKPVVSEPAPIELPQPLPTPRWVKQGPGKIICPILLYHRIGTPKTDNPYFVTSEEFRAQMQALKNWGYTSIPVSLLVDAIKFGAKLPARPVVITFDDGNATVYSQAFPIMREFGFSGVNYLIANYIGTVGYMDVEQLKELASKGWETGSHSMTHPDLTNSEKLEWEVVQSRRKLESLLGVPVETFAYPFGKVNDDVRSLVAKNYIAGMGLGVYLTQRHADLYYLWRRPVKLGWDVQTFGAFLPWNTPVDQ